MILNPERTFRLTRFLRRRHDAKIKITSPTTTQLQNTAERTKGLLLSQKFVFLVEDESQPIKKFSRASSESLQTEVNRLNMHHSEDAK